MVSNIVYVCSIRIFVVFYMFGVPVFISNRQGQCWDSANYTVPAGVVFGHCFYTVPAGDSAGAAHTALSAAFSWTWKSKENP